MTKCRPSVCIKLKKGGVEFFCIYHLKRELYLEYLRLINIDGPLKNDDNILNIAGLQKDKKT